MNLLDKLVKVDISISGAVASAESFDNILIVGPAPATTPSTTPPKVGVYGSLLEIESAGFKSTDQIYKAASIAFANGADKLYVAIQQGEEDIESTLNRAIETPGWYGFAVCTTDEDTLDEAATWAEANQKLFGFTVSVSDGNIENPLGTSYNYTFGFVTKITATKPDNAYTHIACMARAMSYVAGSETWAFKTLAGIEPENFDSSDITGIEANNLNYFVRCAGKNITLNGKTCSGEWIDVIRFRDWLKNDMQMRVYNVLIGNSKVFYTTAGINLVENAMIASLKQGQANGGIAEDEFDEDGNETPGFTTSVPSYDEISTSDRTERTLKNCKFYARLAGAIHLTEIDGNLVN